MRRWKRLLLCAVPRKELGLQLATTCSARYNFPFKGIKVATARSVVHFPHFQSIIILMKKRERGKRGRGNVISLRQKQKIEKGGATTMRKRKRPIFLIASRRKRRALASKHGGFYYDIFNEKCLKREGEGEWDEVGSNLSISFFFLRLMAFLLPHCLFFFSFCVWHEATAAKEVIISRPSKERRDNIIRSHSQTPDYIGPLLWWWP